MTTLADFKSPDARAIYVLVDGKTVGPFTSEEIDDEIARRKIGKSCLAAIEGMPAWRSIPEALIWHAGLSLKEMKDVAEREIPGLAEGGDVRYARVRVRDELRKRNLFPLDSIIDRFTTLLEINASLRRSFSHYDQMTSPEVCKSWPAQELVAFGKLDFKRDWKKDWVRAGGRLFGKRMVALLWEPVWEKLSDFGYPFPPFSMDRLMWCQSIDVAESLKIGLVHKGEEITCHFHCEPLRLVGFGNDCKNEA